MPPLLPKKKAAKGRGRGKGTISAADTPVLEEDDFEEPEEPVEAAPPAVEASSQVRGEQDFWLWIRALDWSTMAAYLYRTAPQIDRKKIGHHSYIMKYVECFDIDDIKKNHGSGGYRIDLVRLGAGSFRICQEYFSIMDVNFPPRLVAGEWIDRPENSDWLWAKEQLNKEDELRRNAATVASASDPSTGLAQTILSHVDRLRPNDPGNKDLVVEMQKGMNAMQQQMLAAADPMKQLGLITTLVGLMKPAAPAGPDPLVQMLMEDRKAMREQISELTKMVTAQASTPRKSLAEELREIQQLAKIVSPKNAPETEENRWLGVVEKVADHVPDLVSAFRAGRMANDIQAGQTPRPAHGFNRAQPTPAAAAAPQASNPAQQTAEAAAAATEGAQHEMPQVSAEQQARYDQILTQFGALIENVAPFLMDKFRNGEDGYEFRDWFIDRKGGDNYSLFVEGCRPEELVELAQQHPILRVALSPPERLLVFFQEFWTAPEDTPEEPEE